MIPQHILLPTITVMRRVAIEEGRIRQLNAVSSGNIQCRLMQVQLFHPHKKADLKVG
jgi:hypothetical protein